MAKLKKHKVRSRYPAAYKKYIRNVLFDLRTLVFAGEYNMDVNYVDWIQDSPKAAASIHVSEVYLQFTVTCSDTILSHWKKEEYSELGFVLLHECCHILTEPLYNVAIDGVTNMSKNFLEDIRERQTQRITNAIYLHLNEEYFHPSKVMERARNK